jgi:phthiocerol/phenolphthiocerol synthesis type-I polyketide synthase E
MSSELYEGPEAVAVVGMACRFPGAENVDAFWRNLRAGVGSISTFTVPELREAGVDAALLAHPDFVPAFGTVEGADLFDADFFELNPREAELMDPQHRLFLEQAWAALEHAGCDPETFPGPIGVFAGTNMNTYLLAQLSARAGGGDGGGPGDALVNRIRSDKDFLATLASYKLNLRGPSLSVQTACSTSLVALHLARQSLLDYQCDAALAGGVSITVPLKTGYVAGQGVFSPDGRCRAFDAAGDGTVIGSGVGVVVLKRLSDALADGDHVHAVVLGSAVNNDGAQKVGYTAPSVDGQVEVVAMAHAVAGVPAESITYVEAHGTGTPMGDPVEVAALTRAFGTERRGFCAIGSVKTNIGHTDAAAGVASLIKTVLALEHGEIPPSLHYRQPNPRIDFAGSPFYVADRLLPWTPEGPRRAGVSAFGVGGTNAHVVLEQAPARAAAPADEGPELLVLSARTPQALDRLAAATAAHLEAHPETAPGDLAFTLARGRKAFGHRRALVAGTTAEAAALLRGGDASRVSTHAAAQADPGVAFLFPGLGTQYAGMGRELYETEPAFRAAMDRCFAFLRQGWGMDLAPVLYPADAPAARGGSGMDLRALLRGGAGPSESDPLQGARWGHPAMFAVGYALAELWKHRGIEPRAVAGHSLGEYVAACVAGVFTLEDALTLVVRRAALLDGIPGSMAAVSLAEQETRAMVDALRAGGEALWLAAVNAPRSCVVSGSTESVARFTERARAQGALVLPLAVRHPFHSGLLEAAREEFAGVVASIRRNAPAIPLAANATGTWMTAEQAQSVHYWVEHLLGPVRFAECVDTLRGPGGGAGGEPVMMEMGPGAVLGAWARQQGAARIAASMRHGEQPGSDRAVLLRALGQLWSHGVAVGWTRQGGAEGRRRVVLPGHPLERKRFWLEAPPPISSADAATDAATDARPAGDERRPAAEWFYAPLWRQTPDAPAPAGAFAGRRVVLFGGSAAAPLAERLRADGAEVVRVEAGAGFADDGARFAVRPGAEDDHARLAEALRARGWTGATLTLHLASLDDAAEGVTSATVDAALEAGIVSLLHWVRAASGAGLLGEGSAVLGATRGAHAVVGTEALRPWQAMPGALLKVVAQEYPRVRTRAVDVDARGWEQAVLREAARLAPGADDEAADVAFRGGRRWERFFGALPAGTAPAQPAVPVREGGVYLVTGGLGRIGLSLARLLAERGAARLVLTGRSGLPPRAEWDALPADGDDAVEIRRRVAAVRALEGLGAEVVVEAADAADAVRMRAVVAAAVQRFGALHGVVHAAGGVPGGLIQLETPERLAEGLAPRVRGTLALHEALEGVAVDFVVLCSSLHALYGGIGAADHAAAGAFQDAFAAWAADAGHPVVSINWDGWSEAGQAADTAVVRQVDGLHPLLGSRGGADGAWEYTALLGPETHWVLDEHRVGGTAVLPGTAYLEMARAAFADRVPGTAPVLERVVFLAPFFVADGARREITLRLEEEGAGFAFRVLSRAGDGAEQEHARGRVLAGAEPAERVDVAAIRDALAPVELVDDALRAGDGTVRLGPRWTGALRRVWRDEGELLAELELPEAFTGDGDAFALHPALLDVAMGFVRGLRDGVFLPLIYERVTVHGPLPGRFFSYVIHPGGERDGEVLSCDVLVVDEAGGERLRIEGCTLRRVPDPAALAAAGVAAARPSREDAGISPREGAEAFARVLEHGFGPQVAVSTRHLPTVLAQARRVTRDTVAEGLRGGAGRGVHPRPEIGVPYVEPRSELEERLVQLFGRALGMDRIGVDDSFFELGGDSLLATQLLSALNEAFQVDLPLRALFEAPTAAQLAVAIVQRQLEAVDADVLEQALAEL